MTTGLGVRIKWDEDDAVFVTVDAEKQMNNVEGLCGTYNNNPRGRNTVGYKKTADKGI